VVYSYFDDFAQLFQRKPAVALAPSSPVESIMAK